jgi:hypothetical protein
MARFATAALSLVIVGLLLSGSASAQNSGASINGVVQDPSGAPVPGANLTLKFLATNSESKAITEATGHYAFSNLLSGDYELGVEAGGFRPFIQRGISVNINQSVRLNVSLELGAVTETVEVVADASPLNFESGEVKGVISPDTLRELPLLVGGITRSAVAFAKLLPGVTTGGGDNSTGFDARVNGGLTMNDEAVLDGSSVADGALGQSGIALSISGHPWSPEAISEISLLTSNYEPQYGSTTSSVITAVTKSGTNEFHGSAYEYMRNTVLNARQFGIAQRPKNIEHEYGGTLGGPMKVPGLWGANHKTYGFINFTQYIRRGGLTAPTISIPSLKQRQGDFSDWRDAAGNLIPVYDPATSRRDASGQIVRDQFNCNGSPNVICPDRIAGSLANEWLKHLPTPTNSQPLNNYTLPLPLSSTVNGDTKLIDVRVDHFLGDNDHFSGTIHYYGSTANPNETELPVPISANGYRSPNHGYLNRINWDHTFRPTLINSFNFGYNNIVSTSVCVATDPDAVPKISGVTSNALPPAIRLQDFAAMGCNGNFAQDRPAWIANNLLSWVRSSHIFKFGVEWRNQQVNNEELDNESGTFNFSRPNTGLLGLNSGNAVASFLLDHVSSANMAVRTVSNQRARQPYLALFVGDTWKVTPKLSLTLGVRWDVPSPIYEVEDSLSFFDPDGLNPGAGNRRGRLAFAGDGYGAASYGRRTPEKTYNKAFAPRLGIAYGISDNTVIRAGYGVFYQQLYYTGWSGGVGGGLQGFNATPSFSSQDGGLTSAFLLEQGFPQDFQRPPFIDSAFRNGQSLPLVRAPEGRPAYAQQWNLTVERQLTSSTYVTAAYVANKGTRLISAVAAVNALSPQLLSMGSQLFDQFQPGQTTLNGVSVPYDGWVEQMTGCPPSVAQALLPYPQYCGNLSAINENAGNSTYHSLQLKLERRFSAGLWILGSYTFSKLISNTDDVMRIDAGSAGSFNPFERQRAKAISVGDVPQTFNLTVSYELPFGKGKRMLSSGAASWILGGWQVTSVFRAQSGVPYVFRSGQCNVPSQFSAACVPGILPGASPLAQEGGDIDPSRTVFNRAAFESPEVFNFYWGQGSRTENIRQPSFIGHDIALLKDFSATERVTVQLRGEFFNIWNAHTFSGGGTWGTGRPFVEDVASPAFGQWTGVVTNPRNIQLGAKIIF